MSEQERVAFPLGMVLWNRLELDRAVRKAVKPNLAQRLLEGELAKRPARFDPFALGEVYGGFVTPTEGEMLPPWKAKTGSRLIGFYARGPEYAARWNGTQWTCPAYRERIGSRDPIDLDYLALHWNTDLDVIVDLPVGPYLGDLATSTGQWTKP